MRTVTTAEWAAALRSGEYPQGRTRLCLTNEQGDPVGFCCLGVLAELLELPKRQGMKYYGSPSEFWMRAYAELQDVGEESVSILSVETLQSVIKIPDVGRASWILSNLVRMNDGDLASFAQIADYLDEVQAEFENIGEEQA